MRMPTTFVPHGGGPWPFVELGLAPAEVAHLSGFLRALPASLPAAPKALLVISAHWEERVPTVTSGEAPPLFFDYYGFPPAAYQLRWPAPGSPALASRTRELLGLAGFDSAADPGRGYDHGTFIPLMLSFPEAEVPVVQLSLVAGLDPAAHLAMGRALAPLREEGVLIVGSGMSYHNMGGFGDPRAVAVSERFDGWLRDAARAEPIERAKQLSAWAAAPAARLAHPREEHLVPLMVVAGAAGEDRGRVSFRGSMMGKVLSGYTYG